MRHHLYQRCKDGWNRSSTGLFINCYKLLPSTVSPFTKTCFQHSILKSKRLINLMWTNQHKSYFINILLKVLFCFWKLLFCPIIRIRGSGRYEKLLVLLYTDQTKNVDATKWSALPAPPFPSPLKDLNRVKEHDSGVLIIFCMKS